VDETDEQRAERINADRCPDCMAPPTVPCGDQPHADRIRQADLRALEHGTCALCGQPMVRGSVEGSPIDAWHPDETTAAACPPIPDPGTDWEGYALATNLGLTPGHPGAEHFVPAGDLDARIDALHGSGAAAAIDAAFADGSIFSASSRPALCPECVNGKHVNCVGQALDPVTDDLVPCTCTHGEP
jgi:hypothetical protein